MVGVNIITCRQNFSHENIISQFDTGGLQLVFKLATKLVEDECQDSSLLKRTPDSTEKRGKTEGITKKKEKRHEETILCHTRRLRTDSLLF